MNPRVAERKDWSKFGAEKGHVRGPDLSTTSVGENIIFRPSSNWKSSNKEENKEEDSLRDQLKDKKVACRICKGDHFTARCPFKDTLPPLDDVGASGAGGGDGGNAAEDVGGLGMTKGSYVAPHLRGKKGAGETMGGNFKDRDDLATLRVTNVSEFAEENDLRDMFERFGRVTRVFLAKDRDTGRAKGFAFISFADRGDAQRACEKMEGCEKSPNCGHPTAPGTNTVCSWVWTLDPEGRVRKEVRLNVSTIFLSVFSLSLFLLWTKGQRNPKSAVTAGRYTFLIMILILHISSPHNPEL